MSRYQRQLAIIGHEGQARLSSSVVLIIGAGGIGSPVLTYLAAAGVGKLIVVDHDKVELTNLHRQTLFNEAHVGVNKANKAAEILNQYNRDVLVESYACQFDPALAKQLVPRVNLVIDGTDNYASRYLINDSCVMFEKPLMSCSVFKNIIQLALFDTQIMCYRCLYPEAPPIGMIPNCTEAGVLGTVTGIAGTLAANLAIHYLLQSESVEPHTLRIFDADRCSMDIFPIKPNEACVACRQKKGNLDYFYDREDFGVYLEDIKRHEYLLVDIRTPEERELIKLEDDLFFPLQEHVNYDFFLNYKEKKILLYCAAGYRSQLVAAELRNQGIDAYYLKNHVKP